MSKAELRGNLRDTYDKYAQERETSTMQAWKVEQRSKFLLLLQKENMRTLLEVGAGTGRDSQYFQSQGLDVVCIDLSPAMVALSRQKGLTAHVLDMIDIRFSAGSFDAAYSMNSLLHLTKTEFPAVLRKIDELLTEEGVFFLGMYGGYDYEGVWENDSYVPHRFFSFFTDEHLKQEVTKLFDILTFENIQTEPGDPLHFPSLILRKRRSLSKLI